MKKEYIPYGIIAILVIFLLLQNSCNRKEKSKLESQIGMLLVEKQVLEKEVNKLGDSVATQKAIVVSDQKQLSNYADSVFGLKKKLGNTIAYYQSRINVGVKDVAIEYKHDTVEVPVDVDTGALIAFYKNNSITVPRTVELDSPYFYIKQTVKKTGINIDDLILKDTLSARLVEARVRGKGDLFKHTEIQAQFTNKSPYLRIEGGNSIIYKPKKEPFLKVFGIPFAIGAATTVAGILILK